MSDPTAETKTAESREQAIAIAIAAVKATPVTAIDSTGQAEIDAAIVVDALLAAGLVVVTPDATEVAQINALPYESVIRTRQGYTLERLTEGWYRAGVPHPYVVAYPTWLPATVLFHPRVVS